MILTMRPFSKLLPNCGDAYQAVRWTISMPHRIPYILVGTGLNRTGVIHDQKE